MTENPGVLKWSARLSGVALLAGCVVSTDPPPAEPSAAGSIARNVILFIGDGMGVSTVTAARIFDGQSLGMTGEEHELVFETFPHVALVKTYNTNQQVPDSAGTATAMMTGRKTRAGVINIGPEVRRQDCQESLDQELTPLGVIAKERGKSVGVVTTTRLTHATPASVFARSPERDWESDQYLPESDRALGCLDIAYQLTRFDVGGGLDVVLGGGRPSSTVASSMVIGSAGRTTSSGSGWTPARTVHTSRHGTNWRGYGRRSSREFGRRSSRKNCRSRGRCNRRVNRSWVLSPVPT